MKLSEFDYKLPEELIAKNPTEKRDASRLMVLHRDDGRIEHRRFIDIVDYLDPSDILVVNNTKVIPARLIGHKKGTGGEVEILLLRQEAEDLWNCLVRPGRRLMPGAKVEFNDGLMEAEIMEYRPGGQRLVKFSHQGEFYQTLEKVGQVPLPPYIDRNPHEADRDRYQTIYAKESGAVAAPTAGLHFTPELMEKIRNKGVEVLEILLHVGWGTFKGVEAADIREHKMDAEFYNISQEVADKLKNGKTRNRRIIAVGTTTSRALESFGQSGKLSDWTEIFIYPPYEFKMVDALVTNFHLPKSTLIMLISALAGRENVMKAYQKAIKERYRFYSYGDAMMII
ncbi:MAG: tRNA preQ1(34) S-adenosylmethionine ribosyltransferase-isomerase QueA [Candidatus Edwardsbacteria bacterium]|nr:tRNA preQ1(34) S-adenosylmethionine ribosyltransferase-isomerase QueA [Candidatus Edwardsbacteria bacterium]MBU1576032.1 tRNA preQ1(34) S-adenosylmethionine ribosyltransferase-isomerase QueA [Candidatus Edwardsbacteria bacterium]MBU2463055.1 tRNA preQ1(34) S-adenosylmethionine ribosyltransferase-isomerase QueA [Candidatus Edwardsbacteria bacterium]MBU2594309.1 tRNA preQ1(34) S-adenosylmethionine ribosyltransferase-isomerase QueA [Candidatus Edwardsbacteria bacterium]